MKNLARHSSAARPPIGPSRSRDVVTLLAVDAGWLPVSALAGTSAFVLPLAALDASAGRGDAAAAGAIVLLGFVLATAVQPLVGAASDGAQRAASRLPWIAVGSVAALAGLVALAFGLERGSLAVAAAGSLIVQVAAGVIAGAQQPLLAQLIGRRRRGVAAGGRIALELAAPVASFAIVALLVAAGERLLAVAVLGATIVAPLAALPLLRSSDAVRSRSPAPSTPALEAPAPVRWRGRRAFVWAVFGRGLFIVAGVAVLRVLPAFVHASVTVDALPQPSVATALVAHPAGTLATGLAAAIAVVGAVFAVPSGWLADRIGRRAPMVAGAWVAMCGAGALTMATDLTGLTIGTLLVAASAGLFLPAQLALCADLAPEGREGEALGALAVVTAAAVVLSVVAAPISALSAGIEGLRLALAVTAVLFAGSGLAGLRAYRFLPASLAVDPEREATRELGPVRAPERPRRT